MAPKQYSVRQLVRNNAADNAEVDKILAEHPLWKRKHARETLARRRFHDKVKRAAVTTETETP